VSVLFLNPVGTLGGGERSLLDLLAVLRRLRSEFALRVIAGEDGPLVDEALRLGAGAEVVPMPRALATFGESGLLWNRGGRLGLATAGLGAATVLPGYLRRLRGAVRRARPQLVHSNGIKCHLLAGRVVPRACPVVWHVRDFLSSRPVLGRLLRRVTPPPALAVANSHAVAADTRTVLPGVRVEAVYNGIDTDYFSPGPPSDIDLDSLAGLPPAPPGTVRIGLVATYARWKGQDVFLQAAHDMRRSGFTGVRFYVVGGPVYSTAGSQWNSPELRARIDAAGLTNCCGLVPFRRDLPPVYRSLDVVVHASTRPEPFGRTIAEAMACGRAVVVSAAGGAAELFEDGVDAVGVTPGDAGALAAAVDRLVRLPEERYRLGIAARRSAEARFSDARYGARLLHLFRQLVGTAD
jgi:glycosyltransferase involved in cell wall biosynthesis